MNATAHAIAPAAASQPPSLIHRLAARFGVEPNKMLATLKATAFRQKPGEPEVTNEQLMALLVVADSYGLNPWTKEIYAFPDKGGIVPVVGVDGWARILNENRNFDGVEFLDAESENGAPPAWIECTIFRKDRDHPTKVREYMAECKRGTGPWGSHPRRMLRHKALMQCARVAFGYVGIYDQDEAERIIDGSVQIVMPESPAIAAINAQVTGKAAPQTLEHSLGETISTSVDATTGEVQQSTEAVETKQPKAETTKRKPAADGPTYAEVRARIDNAKDSDALDVAQSLVHDLPEQFHAELHANAKAKRTELAK